MSHTLDESDESDARAGYVYKNSACGRSRDMEGYLACLICHCFFARKETTLQIPTKTIEKFTNAVAGGYSERRRVEQLIFLRLLLSA